MLTLGQSEHQIRTVQRFQRDSINGLLQLQRYEETGSFYTTIIKLIRFLTIHELAASSEVYSSLRQVPPPSPVLLNVASLLLS